jgi:glycosyltransferase involved in cell wall biosynthesis
MKIGATTRLVVITQRVDPEDPVLGATVAKLRALAERVDELVVLADGDAPGALPANARVHRFAARTKLGRGLRFVRALARELRRAPRPVAVLAHMCPIYAVLAAPLARPLRVPVLLWFAHWRASPTLRLAVRLADRVVTVDAASVPVATSRIAVIGHGIEMRDFVTPPHAAADGRFRLLALGRYSAAKGLAVVLRGVAEARAGGVDVRLRCHGAALTPAEAAHREDLERLVDELRLGDSVTLGGPVPRSDVPGLLADADALVNNMRPGAPDKVVFEAGAAGVPVLVSNPSFEELAGDLRPRLLFRRDDASDLAAAIYGLAALESADRRRLGSTLHDRVVAGHSVGRWADRLLEVVAR